MKINFTKMHGCGNDYIYLNCFNNEATEGEPISSPEKLAITLSNRHFGIGGDGIVLILPSDIADAKMRMFNIDGSEGKMCGNAIRCVAKYLYDNNIHKKEFITIDTLSGIKKLTLNIENDTVKSVKVNMGKAEFSPQLIPMIYNKNKVIDSPVEVNGEQYNLTCVSMGNPHAVLFNFGDTPLETMDIKHLGSSIENSEYFPEKVNVEFVSVLSSKRIKMRVWERGSGETFACGTGACAAVVAATENRFCEKDTDVTVELLGGELVIRYTDEAVFMTGSATTVFKGEIEI